MKKRYELKIPYPGLNKNIQKGDVVVESEDKDLRKYIKNGKSCLHYVDADEVENYPELWKKVKEKEYEILKKNQETNEIKSVKRLKDGEIFSLGEVIYDINMNSKNVIRRIVKDISNKHVLLECEGFLSPPIPLHMAESFDQSSFMRTQDNVKLYPSDTVYCLFSDNTIISFLVTESTI